MPIFRFRRWLAGLALALVLPTAKVAVPASLTGLASLQHGAVTEGR